LRCKAKRREIYIETNREEPQGSLKTIAVKIQEHPECGGVAGLSLIFYPQGRGSDGAVELHAANGVELMVNCKFTVEFSDQSKSSYFGSQRKYLQHFPSSDLFHFKSSPAYRSITVELVSVKKKCHKQDTQQINFAHGEMLRVTWDAKKAEESFGVVGCKDKMKRSKKPYLGKIGCVVGFDNFIVVFRQADNTCHIWGHGALSKLLTSDEVEEMKVHAYRVFLFSLSCISTE